jgi:hypothetical protein
MTTDERLDRAEHAIACLATVLTMNYPLRGPHVAAVQEIAAEIRAEDDLAVARRRREDLERELAAVGGVA